MEILEKPHRNFLQRLLKRVGIDRASGFDYIAEDLFGLIEIKSKYRLNVDELDRLIHGIVSTKTKARTVRDDLGVISYVFTRKGAWSNEDGPECIYCGTPESKIISDEACPCRKGGKPCVVKK